MNTNTVSRKSSERSNRPPKILPWLARKAGLSEAEALSLWRQAVNDVAFYTQPDTASFYSRTLDRLIELVAYRTMQKRLVRPLGLGLRTQTRLWDATMNYWERINVLALDRWQLLVSRAS